MRRLALAVVLAAGCMCARPLDAAVRRIINANPDAARAFWGIHVVDVRSGAVLASENERRFFVPASNAKLFTTALALSHLGPDYRFTTRVESEAAPDERGRVHQLRLIGGGDPNLSARILPYVRGESGSDPLTHIQALADQVVARGIRVVSGDIVGDDTAYAWEHYPEGWAIDDPTWEYGAPVSALTVSDNAFTLYVDPATEVGEPAVVTLKPALEQLTIHNRTVTVADAPAKLTYERLPGSRELVLTGTMVRGSPVRSVVLAIDDPAIFAAEALRDALLDRGVRIEGSVRAVHRRVHEPAPEWRGVPLAEIQSAPLSQSLQVINKVSQNLHAELILREVARVKYGFGTLEGGLKEMQNWLTGIEIPEKEYDFRDASGLSRLTLVTPATISRLLLHMYNSPYRETWLATLPIGGADGTLEDRFDKRRAATNIHAKTGSISHVSALSGYAVRPGGRAYAFSIIVNNYNRPSAAIHKVIDRIALTLVR